MRCSEHNRDLVQLGERDVCPACLAAGSRDAAGMLEEARARQAHAALRRRTADAAIPLGFRDCRFENFVAATPRAEQIGTVLASYVERFASQREARTGFLFTGAPGTGKTHLACAMVNGIVQAGYRATYASLPRLTAELRATFGKVGGTQSVLDRLIEVDFLVIDEIDLHGQSDHDYNTLYDIVNQRYERPGFPTLAVSNRPLERIVADLDERVVSRILGSSKPVQFDWPSRRQVRLSQHRAGTGVGGR